jgi:pyruvate dehydrogenase E1 component
VQQALRAQELLSEHHDVAADVWSATSYHTMRLDAIEVERWNRLHPGEPPRVPFVTEQLEQAEGPVVAVSDWMRAVPDQVARWVPGPYRSLGTDGFGRSDTRPALRRFFEVDAEHVVVATLAALAEMGEVKPEQVAEAIERYEIDPDRGVPFRPDAGASEG